MAGPVPSYLTTQLAAQTAFSVPFGLLALVNGAITTATAAGEFNTTVDCSLFTAEDVSNLRIYLDSEGYLVEFAKNSNNKSLLIDWGKFLDIPGTEITVLQGTIPWLVSIVPNPSSINIFATSNTVPNGVETPILTYTATANFSISQLIAWGNWNGEYLIRQNGIIVGGGSTTAAQLLLNVSYVSAPIPILLGDVVTVTILEYGSGMRQFRVNLLGE
jgi:hypothetical protein